jgi:hypothetical protein
MWSDIPEQKGGQRQTEKSVGQVVMTTVMIREEVR